MTRLSASLYAADPLRLAEQVEAIAPHVESLHLDIMDGMFTPDFGLNARIVGELATWARLPLDVHLMIRDPRRAAVRYAELGARSVAVHLEGEHDFAEIAAILRANGALALAAIRHTTPVAALDAVAEASDGFLFLTAPAGGGAFQPEAFDRLATRPRGLPVTVDGRIEPEHFDRLSALGVDLAVIGATLFSAGRPGARAAELAEALSAELSADAPGRHPENHTGRDPAAQAG